MSKLKRKIQRQAKPNGSKRPLTVGADDATALREAETVATRLKIALADLDVQLAALQRQRDMVLAELEKAQEKLVEAGRSAVKRAGGDLDTGRWNIDLTKMEIARV